MYGPGSMINLLTEKCAPWIYWQTGHIGVQLYIGWVMYTYIYGLDDLAVVYSLGDVPLAILTDMLLRYHTLTFKTEYF